MEEVWYGLVNVEAKPGVIPDVDGWDESVGGGYMTVLAVAHNLQSFREAVDMALAELGLDVAGIDEASPFSNRNPDATWTSRAGQVSASGTPWLGDIHMYPHSE
jgi:hypothetical protein